MLGEEIGDKEYQKIFDALFRYIDLSNEQAFLRKNGRISYATWVSWASGIQSNLRLTAFSRAWKEIKDKSGSFAELTKLINDGYQTDPANWKS